MEIAYCGLWNSYILPKTKRLIYNIIVQSDVLYDTDTYTLNLRLQKKLISTEIDFWQRSARKFKLEKFQ